MSPALRPFSSAIPDRCPEHTWRLEQVRLWETYSSEQHSWRRRRQACFAGTDSRHHSRALDRRRDFEEILSQGGRTGPQPLRSLPASLIPEPGCTMRCQGSKRSGRAIQTSDTSAVPTQMSRQRLEVVLPEAGRFPDSESLYRLESLWGISAGTFSTRQSQIRTVSDFETRPRPQTAACPVRFLPPALSSRWRRRTEAKTPRTDRQNAGIRPET